MECKASNGIIGKKECIGKGKTLPKDARKSSGSKKGTRLKNYSVLINFAPAIPTNIPNTGENNAIGINEKGSSLSTIIIMGKPANSPINKPFNQGAMFHFTKGIINPKTIQCVNADIEAY